MPLLAIPFPAIDPVLVQIGPFAIRWYALSYIAAIFFGWWYSRRQVRNRALWGPAGPPMKLADLDDFVVWATIGIIAGGRLGYVFIYDLPRFVAHPLEIFALWEGGMSFHGGFLGMMVAMIFFAQSRRIPVWSFIDVIAAGVPMGILFVRLANFINGELYGRASDAPWAMVFPQGGDIARHPSQLYEGLFEGLVLFIVIRVFTHRYHRLATTGFVSGIFCAGYGIARTFSEFFREPDIQIGFLPGGLTMGMTLSIPMIVFGIGLLIWSVRRKPAAAAAGE